MTASVQRFSGGASSVTTATSPSRSTRTGSGTGELPGGRLDLGLVAGRRHPREAERVAFVARDDVHVVVEHGLPRRRAGVLHDADAVGTEALDDAAGHALDRAGDGGEVVLADGVHVGGVLARDAEQVAARRGVD